MSVIQEIDAAESLREVHAVCVTLVDWFRDIATYDSLKADCDAIHDRQTILMERIRTGQASLKKTSAPVPMPDQMCGARFRTRTEPSQKVLVCLQDELHQLDASLAEKQLYMRKLAARIVTLEPKSGIEAAALMRFVSRILRSNEKVDRDYLADVLETCVEPLTGWGGASRTQLQ